MIRRNGWVKAKEIVVSQRIEIFDFYQNNGNVGVSRKNSNWGKTQIADTVSNEDGIYKMCVKNRNDDG